MFDKDPALPLSEEVAKTVLHEYEAVLGGSLFDIIKSYNASDPEMVRIVNAAQIARAANQLVEAPTWNQELRKALNACLEEVPEAGRGNFLKTPRGARLQELIDLNDKAGKFYDNHQDAKAAYNELVQGINKAVQDKVFMPNEEKFHAKGNALHLVLVKMAEALKPVKLQQQSVFKMKAKE